MSILLLNLLNFIILLCSLYLILSRKIIYSIILISVINVVLSVIFLFLNASQVSITQVSISAMTTFAFLLSVRFRGEK